MDLDRRVHSYLHQAFQLRVHRHKGQQARQHTKVDRQQGRTLALHLPEHQDTYHLLRRDTQEQAQNRRRAVAQTAPPWLSAVKQRSKPISK